MDEDIVAEVVYIDGIAAYSTQVLIDGIGASSICIDVYCSLEGEIYEYYLH